MCRSPINPTGPKAAHGLQEATLQGWLASSVAVGPLQGREGLSPARHRTCSRASEEQSEQLLAGGEQETHVLGTTPSTQAPATEKFGVGSRL